MYVLKKCLNGGLPMFFEKEYKYNIIEDVDIKIIENALERNNVHLSIIDNSTEWCAFAHY